MAAALEFFIHQTELAQSMGANAPALVNDRWQIESMQQKTQALYELLLKEKGIR